MGHRSIRATVSILAILFCFATQARNEFPRPKELLPNVAFWTKVYGEWTTEQVAIVDSEDLSMIYRVIRVPPLGERWRGQSRRRIIKKAKKEVIASLRELEWKKPASAKEIPRGLTRRIYRAIKHIQHPDKYNRLDGVRAQNGLKNRFEKGYQLAGAHEEEILARLRYYDMPEELIAIVFVESLFFESSKSYAGAAGLWQFMRGTAKEFIHVNQLVDERYDPVIATEAAIEYLKSAMEDLDRWPLAITSYNHGRSGMMRAVEKVNSYRLMDIIKNYKSRRFGFASKNYYAEFLAALDVYKNGKKYFPDSVQDPAWDYSVVEVPKAILVKDLVSKKIVQRKLLALYNPALTSKVKRGREVIPAGFKIRIPKGESSKFYRKFKKLTKKQLGKAVGKIRARHRANGRQRVYDIARAHDILHSQLAKRLGSTLDYRPSKGTIILLRSLDSRFTEVPVPLYNVQETAKPKIKKKSLATADSK